MPRTPILLSPWHLAVGFPYCAITYAIPELTFQKISSSFLDDLKSQHKSRYFPIEDSTALIQSLLHHCGDFKRNTALLKTLRAIDAFASRLQPLFEIIGSVLKIDTGCASTLWGSIRLAFVLCYDYSTLLPKLGSLFSQLLDEMPCYQDHSIILMQECPEFIKKPLTTAISFVYADIIQLGRELCMLFGPEHKETKSLLWTSFDQRLSYLIERFKQHRTLFDIEIPALVEQDDVLKPKGKLLQLHVNRVLDDIKTYKKHRVSLREQDITNQLRTEQDIQDNERFQRIERWIAASNYKSRVHQISKVKDPGSCTWIFEDYVYKRWKRIAPRKDYEASVETLVRFRQDENFLMLQAKPGFGKTILSGAIIDDVSAAIIGDDITLTRPVLAFFHFDGQDASTNNCLEALRAITDQLLRQCSRDLSLLDFFTLLDPINSTETVSKIEQLEDAIRLLVSRQMPMFIILDGVDECDEFRKVLPFFCEICKFEHVKVLMLSRPSLFIPEQYVGNINRKILNASNQDDIRHWLGPRLEQQRRNGLLPRESDVNKMAATLSTRSSSVFLWAVLMIAYLERSDVDMAQKQTVINASGNLESLHPLYDQLLQQCYSKSKIDTSTVNTIFELLAFSEKPWTLAEMKVALAVRPGRRIIPSDYIPQLRDALRQLCGSLVEIKPDETVQFIHISLREFLQKRSLAGEMMKQPSVFQTNRRGASENISIMCLSYLVYNIPAQPLSGRPDIVADPEVIRKNLPLLEFAAKYWPLYTSRALLGSLTQSNELIQHYHEVIPHISAFLQAKASISVWIESCWTFGFSASIEDLDIDTISNRLTLDPSSGQIETHNSRSLEVIKKFSADLSKLKNDWNHLLKVRPCEIWGTDISIFMGSRAWAYNEEATIITIESGKSSSPGINIILAVSKLSMCGRYCGTVRIWRPLQNKCESATEHRHFQETDKSINLENAYATYHINETTTGSSYLDEYRIELPAQDLHAVEQFASEKTFRFPIAFSPDLTQISILQTIYSLEKNGQISEHRIDLFPTLVPLANNANRRSFKHIWASKKKTISKQHAMFYRMKFSPGGTYLALAKRQCDMNNQAQGYWQLEIWKKEKSLSGSQETTGWHLMTRICDIYGDFRLEGSFEFHHLNCALAFVIQGGKGFTTHHQTLLWTFNTVANKTCGSTVELVYGDELQNLKFSANGQFLLGHHCVFKSWRVVNVAKHVGFAKPYQKPELWAYPGDEEQDNRILLLKSIDPSIMYGSVQSSNSVTVVRHNGAQQLCTIEIEGRGRVVEKYLGTKSCSMNQVIEAPEPLGKQMSLALISTKDKQGFFHTHNLFIAHNGQDEFDYDNCLNIQPPLLVEKTIYKPEQTHTFYHQDQPDLLRYGGRGLLEPA